MPKDTPTNDRLARILAVLGFLVSLFGLYFAYHWHQQSLQDRVFVRLDAARNSGSRWGTLDVEVVNIGMRPIYVQEVVLEMGKDSLYMYEHRLPTGQIEPIKPLAPGQPDDFKEGWDSSKHPIIFDRNSGFFRLANSEGKDAGAQVCIQTTRTLFRRPANISNSTIVTPGFFLPELGKKQVRPPAKSGKQQVPPAPTNVTATGSIGKSSPLVDSCS